jgi:16S rRNA (uracil1498-N3)-methyltransferase
MRRRFFVEKFESGSAVIAGETAEHIARVLRAEIGQLYELSDGKRLWLARIEQVKGSKRGQEAIEFSLVEEIPVTPVRFAPELLIALIKFDRFEWCLEKATELGAARIVPLIAARTDKPLAAACGKRRARWGKILLESAQQSRRLGVPVLGEAEKAEGAFAQRAASREAKILLSERPGAHLILGALESTESLVRDSILAIGPEGGWTEVEFDAARAANFLEVSLGENILRAETAVIASLAILRASSER